MDLVSVIHPVRCMTCGKLFTKDALDNYEKLKKEGKDHFHASKQSGFERICCLTTLVSPRQPLKKKEKKIKQIDRSILPGWSNDVKIPTRLIIKAPKINDKPSYHGYKTLSVPKGSKIVEPIILRPKQSFEFLPSYSYPVPWKVDNKRTVSYYIELPKRDKNNLVSLDTVMMLNVKPDTADD